MRSTFHQHDPEGCFAAAIRVYIYFDRPLKKKLFARHGGSVLTQRESHYADWVFYSVKEKSVAILRATWSPWGVKPSANAEERAPSGLLLLLQRFENPVELH